MTATGLPLTDKYSVCKLPNSPAHGEVKRAIVFIEDHQKREWKRAFEASLNSFPDKDQSPWTLRKMFERRVVHELRDATCRDFTLAVDKYQCWKARHMQTDREKGSTWILERYCWPTNCLAVLLEGSLHLIETNKNYRAFTSGHIWVLVVKTRSEYLGMIIWCRVSSDNYSRSWECFSQGVTACWWLPREEARWRSRPQVSVEHNDPQLLLLHVKLTQHRLRKPTSLGTAGEELPVRPEGGVPLKAPRNVNGGEVLSVLGQIIHECKVLFQSAEIRSCAQFHRWLPQWYRWGYCPLLATSWILFVTIGELEVGSYCLGRASFRSLTRATTRCPATKAATPIRATPASLAAMLASASFLPRRRTRR